MLGRQKRKLVMQALLLVIIIAVIFGLSLWLAQNQAVLEVIATYGYLGAFGISVISGFNLAVPIPAASFIPLFLEAGLNFWVLLVVISLGMTMADFLGYFIGQAGREALEPSSMFPKWARSESWQNRSHWTVAGAVFIYAAFIPLPNELIVIPIGLLGYRLVVIAPVLLFGNVVFNLIASWGFISAFALLT